MNTDPIADFLTRIRNAQKARKKKVEIPASKIKIRMAEIMQQHGFIGGFQVEETPNKQGKLIINLKYVNGEGVILGLERVSKPGIRRYASKDDMKSVLNGLGIAIVSTSKGLMTDKQAKKLGVGGEIICNIW
ncbi:MAG: 30S ribosomal protein S8 [Ignavibacteria bacterium]|nr:30S ribosomal protein S8 [Ignavibacteria bacterium]